MKRYLLASLVAGMVLVGCSSPADTTEPTKDGEETSSAQGTSGSADAKSWTSTVSKMGNAEVGKAAPTFELEDEKGEKWTLADYQGKVVVLDFWAFW